MRSGYFLLMSSEFRLNTFIVPPGSRCTYESEDRSAQVGSLHGQPHLGTFTIVFVLAGELLILKPVQHFSDSLGWLREHGLERNPWSELTFLTKNTNTELEESGNNQIIGRQFTFDG